MTQMQVHQWMQESEQILNQARQAIEESRSEQVRQLAEQLPDSAAESDAPISMAIAGQYSAGKSTIVKALTGREDIATGAGITTDQIHIYEWNGIRVVDTPGIDTSIRPEHDELAYDAISRADLLMFVITSGLFDSHIAGEYRRLTIDRGKGYETILVVNKMGHHAEGNSAEAQAIITEALREPLAPFSPEDLLIAFTDAESALEARVETDPEATAYLEGEGNLDGLVENLNMLVHQKGLAARQTTALYAIEQVLQTAIEREPTEDPDADALALIYNQHIRTINESRTLLRTSVHSAIDHATSQIRNAGADLAGHFHPEATSGEIDAASKRTEKRIDDIVTELVRETEEIARQITPDLDARLRDLNESEFHRKTFSNIEMRGQGQSWTGAAKVTADGTRKLGRLAKDLSINSSAVAQGATGLARFSGSAAHGAVLNIGHLFGYSFRPWQAVRFASFIGRAAPFLPIAGAVIDIALQAYEEHRERQRSRKMEELRQEVRNEFLKISAEVGGTFAREWDKIIEEAMDKPLAELNSRRQELNNLRQEQNEHLGHLGAAFQSAQDLIRRIHAA